MITREQVLEISKKKKINETVIFREYLQLLFLNKLYSYPKSQNVFFKGGTAIHLIYKAPRFSEDLDFTVNMPEKDFLSFILNVFEDIKKEESLQFKERKTISGKRFLITASILDLSYKIFINLDFSFREKALRPEKTIIKIEDYPLLFTNYVIHLSKEEIFAEKIRALMTRKKGRDLYDLWYLIDLGVNFEESLVKEKLKYYQIKSINHSQIIERLDSFTEKEFINDLRPFVPFTEREKLPQFYQYLKDYLKKYLG